MSEPYKPYPPTTNQCEQRNWCSSGSIALVVLSGLLSALILLGGSATYFYQSQQISVAQKGSFEPAAFTAKTVEFRKNGGAEQLSQRPEFEEYIVTENDTRGLAQYTSSVAIKPSKVAFESPQRFAAAVQEVAQSGQAEVIHVFTAEGPMLSVEAATVRAGITEKSWEALLTNLREAHYPSYTVQINTQQETHVELAGNDAVTFFQNDAVEELRTAEQLAQNSELASIVVSGKYIYETASDHLTSVSYLEIPAEKALALNKVVEATKKSSLAPHLEIISIKEDSEKLSVDLILAGDTDVQKLQKDELENLVEELHRKSSEHFEMQIILQSARSHPSPTTIYSEGYAHG